jgi:cellulose synthase/poly-beta-1,6-N-acetylglucosamine synthase-like glycosyltransferase
MLAQDTPSYSVVVPLYNEQESVSQLYVKIIDAMDALGEPFEIVFVDDGSKDGTFRQLSEISKADERVVVVRLRRNFGKTAALKAGRDSPLHSEAERGIRPRQRMARRAYRSLARAPAAEPYRQLDDGQVVARRSARFRHDV